MLSAYLASAVSKRVHWKGINVSRFPILADRMRLLHQSVPVIHTDSLPAQYHPGGLLKVVSLTSWRAAMCNFTLDTDEIHKSSQKDANRPRYYDGQQKDGLRHGQGKQVDRWSTYVGEFKNGRKVGYGKETYLDGSSYKGHWLGGAYYGPGKITYADGSTLEGEFIDGCIHDGAGKIIVCIASKTEDYNTRKNARGKGVHASFAATVWSTYEGTVKEGAIHGPGVLTYTTGEVLRGEFKAGKMHTGEGHLKSTYSGNYFIGRWVEGKMEGHCTACVDGVTYVGEQRDGYRHGQGVVTYPTGETLRGEFKDGQIAHGEGTRFNPDHGGSWTGTWVHGRLQGHGVVIHRDWGTYVGHMKDSQRHGQGEVTYPGGEKLTGTFSEGRIINGEGMLLYPADGGSATGTWVNGKLQGHGVTSHKDWGTYVGDLKDGSKCGHGTLTYHTGETLTGEFRGGNIYNGHGTWKNKNSPDFFTGTWVNGLMHGHGTTFKDGWKYVGEHVNGIRHGQGELTFPNGIILHGEFRDHQIYNGEGIKPGFPTPLVWVDGVCTSGLTSASEFAADERKAVKIAAMAGDDGLVGTNGAAAKAKSSSDAASKRSAAKKAKAVAAEVVGSSAKNIIDAADKQSAEEKPITAADIVVSEIRNDFFVYEGGMVGKKRHGQGKMTFSSGEVLEGEFRNDAIFNGHGTQKSRHNNDFRSGTWVEGQLQGQCIASKHGMVYRGEMIKSSYHGPGVITYQDGATLRGEFRDGRIWEGEGVYRYPVTGEYKSGTFRGGKLQGHGIQCMKDRKYEGQFVDGVRHGQGAWTYPTGETHRGEFRDGKMWNGEGTFRHPLTGGVFTGTWVEGKQHGLCTTQTGGSRYEGQMEQGEWHGQGVRTYDTGEVLRGEFVRGKIWNGEGTRLVKGEPPQVGTWVNGEFTPAVAV